MQQPRLMKGSAVALRRHAQTCTVSGETTLLVAILNDIYCCPPQQLHGVMGVGTVALKQQSHSPTCLVCDRSVSGNIDFVIVALNSSFRGYKGDLLNCPGSFAGSSPSDFTVCVSRGEWSTKTCGNSPLFTIFELTIFTSFFAQQLACPWHSQFSMQHFFFGSYISSPTSGT